MPFRAAPHCLVGRLLCPDLPHAQHHLHPQTISLLNGALQFLDCRRRGEEASQLGALLDHPASPKRPGEAEQKREAEDDDG